MSLSDDTGVSSPTGAAPRTVRRRGRTSETARGRRAMHGLWTNDPTRRSRRRRPWRTAARRRGHHCHHSHHQRRPGVRRRNARPAHRSPRDPVPGGPGGRGDAALASRTHARRGAAAPAGARSAAAPPVGRFRRAELRPPAAAGPALRGVRDRLRVRLGLPRLARIMGDFGLAAAAGAAAVSCFLYARNRRVRFRPAWLLFGLSSAMAALGNVVWGWYEVVLEVPVPTPATRTCSSCASRRPPSSACWCSPSGR